MAIEPVDEANKFDWWETWSPDVLAAMGSDPLAHEEATRSLGQSGSSKHLDGFAVVRALNHQGEVCKVVGGMGVTNRTADSVELGLWLVSSHRGWGAGKDALKTAADHWQSIGYSITVVTAIDNEPMIAIAKQLGFERLEAMERTMPNETILPSVEFRLAATPPAIETSD